MKLSGAAAGMLLMIGVAIGFLAGKNAGENSSRKAAEGAVAEGRPGSPRGMGGNVGSGGLGSGGRDEAWDRDPAAAMRRIVSQLEGSPMAQMDFDVMLQVYDSVRWMNPDQIREALTNLDSMKVNNQRNLVISMILINLWAKQDGQGALEHFLESGSQMTRPLGVVSSLTRWVKNDPSGAWTWYEANKDRVKTGGMMADQIDGLMFAALAQQDMNGAFARMQELKPQEKQIALSRIGTESIMNPSMRESFIRNLEKLEDGNLLRSSIDSMISTWAFQDPEGVIEFIAAREWGEGVREELNGKVAATWADVDAQAALEWRLETAQEGSDRGEFVAGAFARWMTQDPDRAREWLKSQPAELRTDALYRKTAWELNLNSNPEEAAGWAQQIQNDAQRISTYQEVYHAWASREEEAADKWLRSLDEATREEIAKAAEGAPGGIDHALELNPE